MQPTPPYLVFPVLDKVGIVLVSRLKVLKATTEDEYLVRLVFPLRLQEIAGLGVYLREDVTQRAA